MKPWQFFLSMALAVLCVVLTVSLILMGRSNNALQVELAMQQQEINKGSVSQQIGVNILRDMGSVAVQDEAMREVLKKNGFTINANNNGNASGTGASK